MNWINEYKEKLKKENLSFFYETKNKTFPYRAVIEFPTGEKIGIKAKKEKNFFYIHPLEKMDFRKCSKQQLEKINLLIEFFKIMAEKEEKPNFFIYKKPFEKFLSKKTIIKLFPYEKYEFISKRSAKVLKINKWINVAAEGFVEIKELNNKYIFLLSSEKIENFFKKLEKKEKIFECQENALLDENRIKYHYYGHNGTLVLGTKNNKILMYELILKIKKEIEMDELTDTLEEIFEKIKQKNKLKLLIKGGGGYFFKKVLSNLYKRHFPEETMEQIYDILSKGYSPIEFEEICADIFKEKNYYYLQKDNYKFYRIGEKIFLENYKEKKIIKSGNISEEEEIFNLYKKHVLMEIDKEMEVQKKEMKKS